MLLNKAKEYYSFGVKIKNDDELIPVGYEDNETDFPESTHVIEKLASVFEKGFVQGKVRAYGITFDTRVQPENNEEKSDAICINIIHRDSKIPKYYFNYSWSQDNELKFGESFGREK